MSYYSLSLGVEKELSLQTKVRKCVKIIHDVKMDFFEKPSISKKYKQIDLKVHLL